MAYNFNLSTFGIQVSKMKEVSEIHKLFNVRRIATKFGLSDYERIVLSKGLRNDVKVIFASKGVNKKILRDISENLASVILGLQKNKWPVELVQIPIVNLSALKRVCDFNRVEYLNLLVCINGKTNNLLCLESRNTVINIIDEMRCYIATILEIK